LPSFASGENCKRCAFLKAEALESDEQLASAVEYIRDGLRTAGIDVEAEEARGALLLLTKHDGHLSGGYFDPDKMITMLHAAVKDALDAGFAGLCAAGDMSWLLDNPFYEEPERAASRTGSLASVLQSKLEWLRLAIANAMA
jgi:hypothetical protein